MITDQIQKKLVRFNLQPSLNRASTYTIYVDSKPIIFTISYHKRTCALSLKINDPNAYLIKNGIYLSVFRDLERSRFASKVFNLDTIKNDKLDYRSKLISIKNKFKDNVFQYFGEKLNFQMKDKYEELDEQPCSNYLLSVGFKMEKCKNDFSFLVFQRKCFSPKYMRFVCRNISLQFYTRKGKDYFENFLNNIKI